MTRASDDRSLLLALLKESGALDEKRMRDLAKAQARYPDSMEEALVRSGLVSDAVVAGVYAQFLGIPLVMPDDELVERCRVVADRIPEAVCRRLRVAPIAFDDGTLDVACLNPSDMAAQQEIHLFCGVSVRVHACPLGVLDEIHAAMFGARDMVREISAAGQHPAPAEVAAEAEDGAEAIVNLDRVVADGKDGHVIRIVNFLLANAIHEGASDIHIEPYENIVRVRYRIDGELREQTPPPRALFVPTVSRLKVLSKMDIAERRVPQDGAISAKLGGTRVDFRVSTVPTVYGEKMVLRILAKSATPDSLEKLGFTPRQAKDFRAAAESPHGLLFVTGPTGSGKSTTLYTCLNLVNDPTVNIVTVEDPVEYRFEGLNQCHVRSNVGLTFAAALRSFLRQDPDIIMVGEVRDQETAQICLRAALTGHLVMSTLHTNDSLQAVNRLIDMGIEPFLLAPALRLVQAQRLSRKLCPDCKEAYRLPADLAKAYGLEAGIELFRPGRGSCGRCRGSGYKGRVGIFEVLPIGDRLRELIMARSNATVLQNAAREEGVEFLADNAKGKLLAGITSLEECADFLRVPTTAGQAA
ncbi:MAG: Flp pilus assembly complex ATPase component TadA [Planctomycetes bacterium]|nr:Flp pilus assembly complex ATPase component TadA [Planctomycetota bacterium]